MNYYKDSKAAISWATEYQGPTPVFVRHRGGMCSVIATKDASKNRQTTKFDIAEFNHREDAIKAAKIINSRKPIDAVRETFRGGIYIADFVEPNRNWLEKILNDKLGSE